MEIVGNGMKHLKFWKHLKTYTSQSEYQTLDPTTPWFEYLSYQECCRSLNLKESLTRFQRYNEYYKSVLEDVKKNS